MNKSNHIEDILYRGREDIAWRIKGVSEVVHDFQGYGLKELEDVIWEIVGEEPEVAVRLLDFRLMAMQEEKG